MFNVVDYQVGRAPGL